MIGFAIQRVMREIIFYPSLLAVGLAIRLAFANARDWKRGDPWAGFVMALCIGIAGMAEPVAEAIYPSSGVPFTRLAAIYTFGLACTCVGIAGMVWHRHRTGMSIPARRGREQRKREAGPEGP